MSTININWRAIRPFKTSQSKGFEQLCFQIALKKYETRGQFTEVDDTGGGDGVEFYLQLPNGKEWGWQAKFYEGSVRLKESGRKRKIIDSLKTSLLKHPKLERWILCTNSQFTPEEQRWFNTVLKSHIPVNKKVTLEHWSEGKLQRWLDEPAFCGIKNAFFGVLQLTPEWFASKFEKVHHLVAEKYKEELHTKDHELYYYYLGPVLINQDFLVRCERNLGSVEHWYKDFEKNVSELKSTSLSGITWDLVKDHYLKKCEEFSFAYDQIAAKLRGILRLINPNEIEIAKRMNYREFQFPLKTIQEFLKGISREIKIEFLPDYQQNEYTDKDRLNHAIKVIHGPDYAIGRLIDDIFYFFRDIGIPKHHSIHILGNAGIGKTHICTNLALENLKSNLPAIFIPGIKFTETTSIETQFLELLDIKNNYSFDDLLETLNILGKIHNTRVPIIIDGLNESINDHGVLNGRWKTDLPGLEAQVAKLSNVVLITTCRKSYQQEIWKDVDSPNMYGYNGFRYEGDVKELVNKYFTKYQIICDLTYLSLSHFHHPLFLKIFCETKSKHGQKVYVQLGTDSIYDIFGQFIKKCDDSVFDRMGGFGNPPGTQNRKIASTYSRQLGKCLWDNHSRLLNFETFYAIFDDTDKTDYRKSKAKALIDEGLLLMRDWMEEKDHVGFTYDMIGGYCIAEYLIDHHKKNLKKFILSDVFFKNFLTANHASWHPLAEDILNCFIALLPSKTGIHILNILPREKKYARLLEKSFLSLFQLSGILIQPHQVNKATTVFKKIGSDARMRLLEEASEIFFVPRHPLNFQFFSSVLFTLPLPDKDLCWTRFVQQLDDSYLNSIVNQFESKNRQTEPFSLPEEEEKNDIVAEFMAWSLSSTIHNYRNMATRGLYFYARRNPQKFFALLKRFITTNDPYIRERLMAVSYGLVTAACQEKSNVGLVKEISWWTYRNFFASRSPYATTHILMRDYASQLVETGYQSYPEQGVKIKIQDLRKPFLKGGIRNWKTAADKNKADYSDGNSLIDFFFAKDNMSRLTKSDFYKPNEKAEEATARIRWRAYQLGYRFDLFGKIDQYIARWNGYGHDHKRLDKYAQKYVWIAYYELAGYMEDQGKLEKYYEAEFPIRLMEFDIDPTFPDPLPERQYFNQDIIGNRNNNLKTWLNNRTIPDIKRLLIVTDLTDEKEEYILIKCFKEQTDEQAERQVFFWINTVFIEKGNLEKVRKRLNDENVAGDVVPSFHEPVFSGEYPTSHYFPKLAWREVDWIYASKKIKRRYSKTALFKGNRQLSQQKEEEFWKYLEGKYHFLQISNKNYTPDYKDDSGNIIEPIIIRIASATTAGKKEIDIDQAIKTECRKRKYQQRQVYIYKDEIANATQPVKIFIPIIKSPVGTVLAKEMTELLNLTSKPQATDLYDKKGKRATVTFRHGEQYKNNHFFIYLRRDLLDKFLEKTDFEMIWHMQGERNHYTTGGHQVHNIHPHWKTFSNLITYNNRK